MGIGFGKWAAKKVAETITKVKPGTKFKGQSTIEAIKKKGKEFKSKTADEAKKAQEAEFKKKIVDKENRKKEFRKSGFYKYFTNQ